MTSAEVFTELSRVDGINGVGHLDTVESRYIGMKSRGCCGIPGSTIMFKARHTVEPVTLDHEVTHLKGELVPKYIDLTCTGYWWNPEHLMLQQVIDAS